MTDWGQPIFKPWATIGFTVSYIYNEQFRVWHVGKRYICKQSPPILNKIFVYNFHYILYKYRKNVFYCFINWLYQEKTQNCMFFKPLIKREILTSRKVVYTKACSCNQFLFWKKDAFQNTDFSRLKCQLKRKKVFNSKTFSNLSACVISARKAKHLDFTTMFTYSRTNTPLGQSERELS